MGEGGTWNAPEMVQNHALKWCNIGSQGGMDWVKCTILCAMPGGRGEAALGLAAVAMPPLASAVPASFSETYRYGIPCFLRQDGYNGHLISPAFCYLEYAWNRETGPREQRR